MLTNFFIFLFLNNSLLMDANPAGLPLIDCSAADFKVIQENPSSKPGQRWKREIQFPAIGRFAEESHYVTTVDKFPEKRPFPKANVENIEAHLRRSFQLYRQYDPECTFEGLYNQSWQKEWTPAENGKIGQGSEGLKQVTSLKPEMELWLVTMMWGKGQKPKPGAKFLMSANGKNVVVIAGYETGPAGRKYLGGVTREVHKWLGTDNQSLISIAYLNDQNVPFGPVNCQ